MLSQLKAPRCTSAISPFRVAKKVQLDPGVNGIREEMVQAAFGELLPASKVFLTCLSALGQPSPPFQFLDYGASKPSCALIKGLRFSLSISHSSAWDMKVIFSSDAADGISVPSFSARLESGNAAHRLSHSG